MTGTSSKVSSAKFFTVSELAALSSDNLSGLYIKTIGYLESYDIHKSLLVIRDGKSCFAVNTKYIEPFPFS